MVYSAPEGSVFLLPFDTVVERAASEEGDSGEGKNP